MIILRIKRLQSNKVFFFQFCKNIFVVIKRFANSSPIDICAFSVYYLNSIVKGFSKFTNEWRWPKNFIKRTPAFYKLKCIEWAQMKHSDWMLQVMLLLLTNRSA